MKAFVSGGAGFVGSHLVERLLSLKQFTNVVVYDNFSSGSPSHLRLVEGNPRLTIINGDLKNPLVVNNAMAGCHTVFHLAANPDISKAVTNPELDFWEGTYLAQNLLEAMRKSGAKRIFYTSGSGVYGENPNVSFCEDHGPCIPISTYGASKLACEALIASYCSMFGIVGHVFRLANIVGPRQTHGVGYDFIRRLRSDPSHLRILGDGSQSKSYIHIDDVLDAFFQTAEKSADAFGVFNVATSDAITVCEIADLAVEVLGLSKEAVEYEFTGGDRGWKGDVPVISLNSEKIRRLGWTCKRSSREAMKASLAAMLCEIPE